MQRVVGVPEDGVPLVNLLHDVRVQAVLLENKASQKHYRICVLLHTNVFPKSTPSNTPTVVVETQH